MSQKETPVVDRVKFSDLEVGDEFTAPDFDEAKFRKLSKNMAVSNHAGHININDDERVIKIEKQPKETP